MRAYKFFLLVVLIAVQSQIHAQNVGIDVANPTQKLDVNGTVRTNAVIINNGGSQYDFLMKNNATGEVGFRKAYGALAINYIICYIGQIPSPNGVPKVNPMLGEIKLFAGPNPPSGWLLCNGQMLVVSQMPDLFNVLGNTYGGDGVNTFALPDLRSSVIVGPGLSQGGYQWTVGQKVN